MFRPFSFVFAATITLSVGVFSDTINVPADYSSIQEAIDVAFNGDTVLVYPGTYVEKIDFLGKAITVKSTNGAETTVIDGGNSHSVVTFAGKEDAGSVLEGFTITNGYAYNGGGIHCNNHSSPIIRNNSISGNTTTDDGSGIYCWNNSSPKITKNIISGNTAYGNGSGGGIFCDLFSSPEITSNTIMGNTSTFSGGGIYCGDSSSSTITENTVMNNTAPRGAGIAFGFFSVAEVSNNLITGNNASFGGGVYCFAASPNIASNTVKDNSASEQGGGICCKQSCSPTIVNTICRDNAAPEGREMWIGDTLNPSTLTIAHSNVKGAQSLIHVEPGCTLTWGNGMIDADPLFVDADNNDFHLTFNSPCRDTGDNNAATELFDFEGDPRIAHGTVDMGADEFYTHLYCTGEPTPCGKVEAKFVGLPETAPVWLWFGSSPLEPPSWTMFGYWHLYPPLIGPVDLGSIPSHSGVLILPAKVHRLPPPPYDLFMQALMGFNSDSLTNLCVLEVR